MINYTRIKVATLKLFEINNSVIYVSYPSVYVADMITYRNEND